MTRTIWTAIIAGATLSLSGCGTVLTKSNGAWGQKYSGTSCSALGTAMATGSEKAWIGVPFLAIDTVISAVMDTIVLPIDIVVRKPDKKNACKIWSE